MTAPMEGVPSRSEHLADVVTDYGTAHRALVDASEAFNEQDERMRGALSDRELIRTGVAIGTVSFGALRGIAEAMNNGSTAAVDRHFDSTEIERMTAGEPLLDFGRID